MKKGKKKMSCMKKDSIALLIITFICTIAFLDWNYKYDKHATSIELILNTYTYIPEPKKIIEKYPRVARGSGIEIQKWKYNNFKMNIILKRKDVYPIDMEKVTYIINDFCQLWGNEAECKNYIDEDFIKSADYYFARTKKNNTPDGDVFYNDIVFDDFIWPYKIIIINSKSREAIYFGIDA